MSRRLGRHRLEMLKPSQQMFVPSATVLVYVAPLELVCLEMEGLAGAERSFKVEL